MPRVRYGGSIGVCDHGAPCRRMGGNDHVERIYSRHLVGRPDRGMACRTDRQRHRLRPRRGHLHRNHRRPHRQLVVAPVGQSTAPRRSLALSRTLVKWGFLSILIHDAPQQSIPVSGHFRDTLPMTTRFKLDSKTARLKLPVRMKPYTNRAAPGIRIAYRRNEGPGTWSVPGGGGLWLKKIGIADDLEPADGVNVLDYWQASDRARDLARARDADGGKSVTVAEALAAYRNDLQSRGGDPYNADRVLAHLPKPLLSKAVGLLRATELRR